MWWKQPFASVLFLPKPIIQCNEKNVRQMPIGDILQNTRSVLLKTVQVIKNKERLRICHSLEEPNNWRSCSVLDGVLEQKRVSDKN